MTGLEISIGTRGSRLALAQAKLVAQAFELEGNRSRVVIIETDGDRRAPDSAWGEGAFVAAIARALRAGLVDVAVHSAKDVPTEEDPSLRIGAYLPRADPRDALVVRSDRQGSRLDDLAPGSRVGTDSPRRTGFLLARRPDLAVHPLHGNVDTRLRRLDGGETDALVLACAGLDRLGFGDRIAERIAPEVVPPAPGQGAIAVQIRGDDARMLVLAGAINDQPTRLAVEAERAFLRASGGGCRSPIGALATISDAELDLLGGYASPDGSVTAFARRRGDVAMVDVLAHQLAEVLDYRSRRRTTVADAKSETSRPMARRVLVTRAAEQADDLLAALRAKGLDPVLVPTIAVEFAPAGTEIDAATRSLHMYAWVVVTSANGARAILKAAERVLTDLGSPRWAAIGSATRSVLEPHDIEVQFQSSRSNGAAMGAELPVQAGDRVLVVRGDLADETLAASLHARGAEVDDIVAYRTLAAPDDSKALLRRAFADGPVDAVVFTSGSTARGLVALGRAESLDVLSVPSICIGPETADEARLAGFRVVAVSASPDVAALASITARALNPEPLEVS